MQDFLQDFARAFDASMEFTSATYEGEPCLQIVFRQQTVDAQMVKELDTLRQRDPVTELFNRQHFMGELEASVAVAAGLAAAFSVQRHAVRRLGGITGDVLGALAEIAATVTLVVAAMGPAA